MSGWAAVITREASLRRHSSSEEEGGTPVLHQWVHHKVGASYEKDSDREELAKYASNDCSKDTDC
jgi:hypothetical protein